MKIQSIVKSDSKQAQAFRFLLVGGFATLLQYGAYIVFVHAVHLSAVLSTVVSYAVSFVFNFILSSYFTFHSDPNAKKGIAFTVSHLINMGMQTGLVAIFKNIVGPTLALLPALAICVPTNYFLVRFAFTAKIFQSRKQPRKETLAQELDLTQKK